MKKTLTIMTVAIVAIGAAVMAFAAVTAPKSSATTSFCHATTLSIKVATTAAPGKTLTVTGKEARVPEHTVKATLQSRKSTSTTWVNGASVNLSSTGSYSLKWKAPAKKGSYKIRVRITHSGASHKSATRTVAVK
jgi:hypothetical protein